jgi:tRNA G10  N-methylase Trm11
MSLYAFELGRKKDLCFAELITVLGKDKLVERNLDTAIFDLKIPNYQGLQDKLGGTVKIVKIWEHFSFEDCRADKLEERIRPHLEEIFTDHKGKINFAVSTLSFNNPREINIKQILNFSKLILKSLGLNSRFVNKNFENTKPSTIYAAHVLEKGIDLNIIKGNDKLFLGETVAIQDIDKYSKRDYDKPWRDARVGMLPPKVAQIMVNLAGANSKTIYDPFCGTGTTLTEGLLMGKDVVGSDIDQRMVDYSEGNLKWSEQEFQTKNVYRAFVKDARFLTKEDLPERVDAIITEGYLSEPVSRLPAPEIRQKVFRELANLHLNWLTAVHRITPKNCKVVMCVAGFRKNNDTYRPEYEFLPRFNDLAQETGFRVVASYIYDRPDQIIVREIKVLEKVS